MRKITTLAVTITALLASTLTWAQRSQTPTLDRGLVAVKTDGGVFCSWRINGEEYYDVTYNIYRDGTKLNSTPLTVSNYTDASGSSTSTYTVTAVVRGTEQTACDAASVLSNNYLEIVPDHGDLTSTFQPNDATIADVDGDGEMELLIKFVNTDYSDSDYSTDATEFDIIECYKLDGTKLWWIDCGPNMTDFQSNEINIAAYDWDGDGKAECVMRAADNTRIYQADGDVYIVGDETVDTRSELVHGTGTVFTHTGDEFLLYFEGATGEVYVDTEYPLKRLEDGETSLSTAWGDGYGHRSSKHFFGAPYLDGQTPSIFLARGIYTRHKMIAYDVDPGSHTLTTRWTWNCNDSGSDWYGQGYHNYTIADVDLDGRDEIVFGSMVIDDNGNGLSTTGLGHGDAHHVGDLNPYAHGLEVFACNEDEPANNYRDATTSEIYYRYICSSDDGRCMAGNFTNDVIGSMGFSNYDSPISCVTGTYANLSKTGVTSNFRTYWDGDLLDESFNGSSTRNSTGTIYKYGSDTAIESLTGSLTNNDTKATPCLQADIFGDWREEIVMRSSDNNIRIYTTTIASDYGIYTLLDDHQYRNAMITQMNGYNQPPHLSYYLGEADGITIAPPPLITNGRTVVSAGGSIGSSLNDQHVLLDALTDATYTVESGAQPYILTVNAPTHVEGHDDNDNITTTYYTHTLTGSAFSGSMRLVKQGDGTLVLPAVEQTYTGATNVWGGTLSFDGTLKSSQLWLNRFTTLISDGGTFNYAVEAEYASSIKPGDDDNVGTIAIDTLVLNFGAQLSLDVYADGTADLLTIGVLDLNTFSMATGMLDYDSPVISFRMHPASGESTMPAGKYQIATIGSFADDCTIDNFTLTGLDGNKASLLLEDGKLYLEIADLREPTTIYWRGTEGSTWDFAETENFVDANGNATWFVTGDDVIFDDNATLATVNIAESVAPASVTFANSSLAYTLTGDSITGTASLLKSGTASVTISNTNTFTGGTTIKDGHLIVSALAYSAGSKYGALGGTSATILLGGNGTLETKGTVTCSQPITVTSDDTISVASSLLLDSGVSARSTTSVWNKAGNGSLTLANVANSGILHVVSGTVYGGEVSSTTHTYPPTVYLDGGSIVDVDNVYTYSTNSTNFVVDEGKTASWTQDTRCDYTGTLTGSGTLNLKAAGTRGYAKGNWSNFEGKLNVSNDYLYFLNSYGLQNAAVTVSSTIEAISPQSSSTTYDLKLGSLAGSGTVTLNSSKTLTVGYRNEDSSFSGTIGGGKLTKTGTGKFTLTALQTNVGAVTVNGGTLQLTPSSSNITTKFFGTSTVTVNSGGALAGRATLADVYVNSGATLIAGSNTSDEVSYYSTAATNFYFIGGTARFCLRNFNNKETSRSYLEASSSLYFEGGTLEVYFGPTLDPDQITEETLITRIKTAIENETNYFQLWDAGSFTLVSGTELTLSLPELPENYEWDTSELQSTSGILRVIYTGPEEEEETEEGENAVSSIEASSDVLCTLFDITGVRLAEFEATRSDAEKVARTYLDRHAIYLLRMTDGKASETIKIRY